MSEKLNQANRILDRACKQAGMDPVQVRVAMINALKDKQRETATVGAGYSRIGPTEADMEKQRAYSAVNGS